MLPGKKHYIKQYITAFSAVTGSRVTGHGSHIEVLPRAFLLKMFTDLSLHDSFIGEL